MNARQRLESLGFVCEGTGGNCKAMILRTAYPVPGRPGQCVEIWATDGNLGVDFEAAESHAADGEDHRSDSGDPQILTVGWYEGESGAVEGRGTTEVYPTVDEMIAAIRGWLDWRARR
ncbi:MAG TPA: hypothetical protein VIV60_29610 [Polyangiaceae bacterium]